MNCLISRHGHFMIDIITFLRHPGGTAGRSAGAALLRARTLVSEPRGRGPVLPGLPGPVPHNLRADGELLDGLVLGHALGAVGATHGLHVAAPVLVATVIPASACPRTRPSRSSSSATLWRPRQFVTSPRRASTPATSCPSCTRSSVTA